MFSPGVSQNARMGQRSSLHHLPQHTRVELDRRIAADSYGTQDDLRAWLASEGHEISRSALGRYVFRKNRQNEFGVRHASLLAMADYLEGIAGRMRELHAFTVSAVNAVRERR